MDIQTVKNKYYGCHHYLNGTDIDNQNYVFNLIFTRQKSLGKILYRHYVYQQIIIPSLVPKWRYSGIDVIRNSGKCGFFPANLGVQTNLYRYNFTVHQQT